MRRAHRSDADCLYLMFPFPPSRGWKRTSNRCVCLWERFGRGLVDCIRSGLMGRSVRTVCRREDRSRILGTVRESRRGFARALRIRRSARRCVCRAFGLGAVRRCFLSLERRATCRILSFGRCGLRSPGIRAAYILGRTKKSLLKNASFSAFARRGTRASLQIPGMTVPTGATPRTGGDSKRCL
jgi:hypothetical protein